MGDARMIEAAGAALAAALLFAVGSALQHRTSASARITGARPAQVLDFVRSVGRHPGWALAMLVEAAGLGLHAVALHIGTLILVQPVLVTTIVFAIVVRLWMDRRPARGPEIRWALLLTAGLAVFLVMATPGSTAQQPADRWPAVALSVASAVAVVAMTLASRGTRPRARAFLLGAAAGITYAGAAALIKTSGDILVSHGVAAMFTEWPFWATLVVGGTGMVLNQVAFQTAPISASLPAIQTADPLLSLVLGVVVYDEQLRHGLLPLGAQIVSLLVVLVAAVVLARAEGGGPQNPAGAGDVAVTGTSALSPEATARMGLPPLEAQLGEA